MKEEEQIIREIFVMRSAKMENALMNFNKYIWGTEQAKTGPARAYYIGRISFNYFYYLKYRMIIFLESVNSDNI